MSHVVKKFFDETASISEAQLGLLGARSEGLHELLWIPNDLLPSPAASERCLDQDLGVRYVASC